MLEKFWHFAAPIKVTCAEIGNCSAKTKTLDAAFTNTAHLLIGVIGGLAMIFVIVSGLQMALSAGDPQRYKMGRQGLLYSLVGVAVAICAYAIVTFVAGAF